MAGLPWIAAMAFFMQALDATILNTALPAIAHSLNRSPLAMQSAIISYTLTVAMLIPVSGWLADRFGTRKVFIIAVGLFTLGSLACALSGSLMELVIFRVIQGVGGAMMMPVARLALLRAYPRSELLPVLNFVTMPGLVGPILGPVLGGVLVTWASWHWSFLINIPNGIIGILYARKCMPDFTTPRRPFDTRGFLLFGLSLAHSVALGAQLPRRAPEGGLRGAVEFMIFRPRQRANAVADRQLPDALRAAKLAGRFAQFQPISVLQTSPFQPANADLQIRAARSQHHRHVDAPRHRQIAADTVLRIC